MFQLNITSRDHKSISGEWRDPSTHTWRSFYYMKIEDTPCYWNGTFELLSESEIVDLDLRSREKLKNSTRKFKGKYKSIYFKEYNVKIQINEETGAISGYGTNRYGRFILKGKNNYIIKKYIDRFKVKPKSNIDQNTPLNPIALDNRTIISRQLRLVFNDKYWFLERDVMLGKVNLPDVIKYLIDMNENFNAVNDFTHKCYSRIGCSRRDKAITELNEAYEESQQLKKMVDYMRQRVEFIEGLNSSAQVK